MEDISEAEKQEFQHFINIIYSYMTYKRDGSVDVERIYRSFDLLSKDDKELLKESPARRTFQILQALMLNQQFISLMLSSIVDVDEGQNSRPIESNNYTESMEDILKRLRYIVKNSSFCRIPQEVEDPEIQPTTDPVVLQRNMNWVRTTLRQFVRDWSEEGAQERNQCFEPLLDALKRRVPIVDKSKRPKVLCPGSGLGRLPFEVLNLGYASQGNEFSYFMLIGSFFIINHSIKPKSLKIYPYCLDTSNRMTFKDQLQPVAIPDVSPADSNFEGHDFSMCAGEFTEVYENIHEEFDAVLTSFFLDTAKNVITYVRTIAKITKKGGLWANIGPLLYHYADISHNSIELPWDELESIISKWFKIENLCWKDANYTSNPSSMMKTQYKCVYFEAIRSDVEVIGRSNIF
ncbi:hypothetical protein BEWA_021080 [Theileria equi strain WA]|uniref:carnosine N-methyltransferase n=1 Tax=Theileria equi strain WA TaxID=1537102 RepID=L0AUF4_THEEQ|nr:hypothetical protein BEWA_021080 [Theileria equi strain WA]AFZ79262.1 hypothetical protein BEWA_021080 [Theileria equi strain WA]|eukprot:XP_004828928.1 hypothetical protein BEWA_021080 [Theileria equi strain WA]